MPEPRKHHSTKKPETSHVMHNIEPEHEKVSHARNPGGDRLVEMFLESNLSLQHKITDLVVEIKELNKKVGGMVTLFTEAGEHIKKGKYEEPLMVKLDDLLEQNKNIAKGLLLLERFVREKQAAQTAFAPRPFQRQEG